MIGYIYTLQCKTTGNVFYVGSTCNSIEDRLKLHKSSSRSINLPVYEHIRNNGIDFCAELVDRFECESKSELLRIESYWIDQFRQWGFDIKNVVFNKPKYNNYQSKNAGKSFPVQLGELKPILMQEAYEQDRSLHYWIRKILKEYCAKKEKREMNFGKEKNDNAGT